MRTHRYIQEIKGKLTSITIMPTYGQPSYIFRSFLNLPHRIERNENEIEYLFRERVARQNEQYERKLYSKIGENTSGIWLKKNFKNNSQVKHYYLN